jgi:hypothetical protein
MLTCAIVGNVIFMIILVIESQSNYQIHRKNRMKIRVYKIQALNTRSTFIPCRGALSFLSGIVLQNQSYAG